MWNSGPTEDDDRRAQARPAGEAGHQHRNLMPPACLLTGQHPDVVLDAVGIPQTIKSALKIVKATGTIVVMGLGAVKEVPIDFTSLESGLIPKEIRLLGSWTYSLWPDAPSDYVATMRMMKAGKIIVDPIVTHEFSIDEWEEAFAIGPENSGKVMFTKL